jgi:hypothetical protein
MLALLQATNKNNIDDKLSAMQQNVKTSVDQR